MLHRWNRGLPVYVFPEIILAKHHIKVYHFTACLWPAPPLKHQQFSLPRISCERAAKSAGQTIRPPQVCLVVETRPWLSRESVAAMSQPTDSLRGWTLLRATNVDVTRRVDSGQRVCTQTLWQEITLASSSPTYSTPDPCVKVSSLRTLNLLIFLTN